jgi:flagellar biosynthetic protein FliR
VTGFQLFLLIMLRHFGMFVVAPFFASLAIPVRVKATLALFSSLIVFPLVAGMGIRVENGFLPFMMQAGGELVLGIAIGFIVAVFFTAFQFAGQLFSFQMGLSISMAFDPESQMESPVLGQMFSLFAVMVFLSVNAHHHLISGIRESYRLLPVLEMNAHSGLLARGMTDAFTRMFGAAIHVGLPIIGTSLLLSVTLGILAKTSPQLNVLMLGFPVQIAVGFGIFTLAVPFMFRFVANWVQGGIGFTMRLFGGQ